MKDVVSSAAIAVSGALPAFIGDGVTFDSEQLGKMIAGAIVALIAYFLRSPRDKK